MHKRLIACLIVLLAGFAWGLALQAQEAENDGAAELIMITPKPGQGAALEAAIRDYHLWVADKEGHFEYNWYMIETGTNTGKYVARSGDHNWSDFDAEYDWEEEASEVFEANVAPLVESAVRHLTVELDQYASWPEDFSGYTLFQIHNWYIKPGQYGKFHRGLARIHEALQAGNFSEPYGFQSTVSGAKGSEVSLVLPMKGYAGMAEPDPSFEDIMISALGSPEAFGEFMADWGTSYHPGESFLVRLLPEASDYGDND